MDCQDGAGAAASENRSKVSIRAHSRTFFSDDIMRAWLIDESRAAELKLKWASLLLAPGRGHPRSGCQSGGRSSSFLVIS